MAKKYRVVFVLAEINGGELPCTFGGAELDDVVTASSKSDAVIQVVGDYDVYRILSVERIK